MINSFEKEADLSPDGIVSGSSVLHEQSIEVAAAEEALGDCIYNVGSAFGNGKLDSTTFLKVCIRSQQGNERITSNNYSIFLIDCAGFV